MREVVALYSAFLLSNNALFQLVQRRRGLRVKRAIFIDADPVVAAQVAAESERKARAAQVLPVMSRAWAKRKVAELGFSMRRATTVSCDFAVFVSIVLYVLTSRSCTETRRRRSRRAARAEPEDPSGARHQEVQGDTRVYLQLRRKWFVVRRFALTLADLVEQGYYVERLDQLDLRACR